MFDAIRERSNALIVFNNFEINPFPSEGILDSQKINGLANTIWRLNQELLSLKDTYIGILLLDLDLIVSKIGMGLFWWRQDAKPILSPVFGLGTLLSVTLFAPQLKKYTDKNNRYNPFILEQYSMYF